MIRRSILAILVALAFLFAAVSPFGAGDTARAQSESALIWGLVPAANNAVVLESAQAITKLLNQKTGLTITPVITADYYGLVEAMCKGEVQIGSLNTFGYLVASARKCADVSLVSLRNKSTTYRGQVIARVDSGLKKLSELKDKTFCRPDPLSTSGWIVPSILLRANQINPATDLKKIVDAGGHDAVVDFVYSGKCDAGATFEDARSLLVKKYPDVNDRVAVIAYSAPIPNDTVSFIPALPAEKRSLIAKTLIEIAADKNNAEVFKNLASWTGVAEANDGFFDDFRQQLIAADVQIETLLPAPKPATPAATSAATSVATAFAATQATTAAR